MLTGQAFESLIHGPPAGIHLENEGEEVSSKEVEWVKSYWYREVKENFPEMVCELFACEEIGNIPKANGISRKVSEERRMCCWWEALEADIRKNGQKNSKNRPNPRYRLNPLGLSSFLRLPNNNPHSWWWPQSHSEGINHIHLALQRNARWRKFFLKDHEKKLLHIF